MTTWRVTTSTVTFVRLHDELLKYHRARVDQTADAEDMLSETWLAAGRLFEKRSSLRVYLYAIARRLVSQYWRARGGRFLVTDQVDKRSSSHTGQDEWLIGQRNHDSVHRALRAVPEIYREAFRLWLNGHSNFEIAARLGTLPDLGSRGKATLTAELMAKAQAD
jgi:DNA-directed RNA polymerase specialized sigma24 family protein